MAAEREGPGPVAAVHRIFIVTALVGALVFAVWDFREYLASGARNAAISAALAFMVAAGLAVYLRKIRDLRAKLVPRREGRG
jgi:hypothetical protein